MNKSTKIIAACAMAVGLASAMPMLASASPFYGHRQAAVEALTPEKQTAFNAIMKDSFQKMQPLREQLYSKEMTLRALSPNPNTKPEQITALVDEIAALRKQMNAEFEACAARVQKEVGIDASRGFGPGMGMGGMGPRQGMRGDSGHHWGGHGSFGGHRGGWGNAPQGR
ncbi:periplasmic heavy metal sensor [Desulfovibrio sp. OttesenSCG-928-I05]|nr:periplasmic heavy metal sensor [Desulfovibrio sp. OttesenSCG-928-I05]